jgi:hypothetical protein
MAFYVQIAQLVAVVAVITSIFVIWYQYRQDRKLNFLKCTERFIEIQKLFIDNPDLSKLNISKSNERLNDTEKVTLSKEIALCSMMFQLMEDVWIMHKLGKHKTNKRYSGWNRYFKEWMSSDKVQNYWNELKVYYGDDFIDFVKEKYINS